MDLPADSAAHVAVPVIPTETTRPTRRPSGEPPALPHHLRTSGIGWLLATVLLVGAAMVVFSGGPSSGVAMTVTVADDAVVRWLADLDAPGVVGAFRALAAVCSGAVLSIVANTLIITLVVLRRFRHLIIWLGVITVLQVGAGILLAARAHRPRPFGADIRAGWSGWAMPSLPMTLFTAGLVAILYSLVPEGRWRSAGKWVATTVVVMVGLSRVALGVDAPSDVLVGAVLGVTVPLLAFRWFTPNEVFPVSYRRGRTAHLDVEGARGQAIRRALHDQLGVTADEVTPFGLAGSAGSTPLRISVPEDPPRATCRPTAGTSSAASCCTDSWRTSVRSTPCGGWSSRRTTPSP
jgi:membrane-associated phospholipid phosphatase